MKKVFVVLISLLMVFSLSSCFGSDEENMDPANNSVEEEIEEAEEIEETEVVTEETEEISEPLIQQRDGYTWLQSLFMSVYLGQDYDEVKKIAETCDLIVETSANEGNYVLAITERNNSEDGNILGISFDEDDKLNMATYNIRSNRWFVQLTNAEKLRVNHPGTFLNEHEKAFEKGQYEEALAYALALPDAYQGD